MELFTLSKKMLEFICVDGEDPLTHYQVYPFSTHFNLDILSQINFNSIEHATLEVYSHDLGRDVERLDAQGLANVYHEAFQNWSDHAPINSTLTVGIFFGSKGICCGFYDGGDFFRNPKLKHQIENRVPFEKFDERTRGDNCQSGFNEHIYPCSDMLEVDVDKGILYAAMLKEYIIAPAGEQGSDYCYKQRCNRLNVEYY